jgi:peptide/nickel transport system permease protein
MVPSSSRPEPRALTAILRRTLNGLLTALAGVTLTFFGLRLGAGDPVAALLSQGLASPQQAQALRESLGLNRSLFAQYADFLGDLLRGDLGHSLYTGRPVLAVIAEQLPSTLRLTAGGLLMAAALGLVLGCLAAWKKAHLTGRTASLLAGLATALPVSFTGILAIVGLNILLQTGHVAAGAWLRRWLLPSLVLGLASGGAIARVVDVGLSVSLAAPYMTSARARGITGPARLLWHALRPALPPAVSLGALEAAYLLSGTVVTEMVFSRPGLGRLLVGAILQGDYPVAQGLVALSAVVYTLSHLAADLTAMTLDPRLRRPA